MTAYNTSASNAVDRLAARMTAALQPPRPPRLTACLTFRQWADAVDAGKMPVIRAHLRAVADRVWAEIGGRA